MLLMRLVGMSVKNSLKKLMLQGCVLTWFFVSTLLGKTDLTMAEVSVMYSVFLLLFGPLDIMNYSSSMGKGGWSYYCSLGKGRIGAFLIAFMLSCSYSILLVSTFIIVALVIDPALFRLAVVVWIAVLGYLLAVSAIVFGTNTGNVMWARFLVIMTPIMVMRNQGTTIVPSVEELGLSTLMLVAGIVLTVEGLLFIFGYLKFRRKEFC